MGVPLEPTYSLLVVACFSRHSEALAWSEEQMVPTYGAIRLRSADFDFHHTRYYEPEMGPGLRKRLVVFEPLAAPDCLLRMTMTAMAPAGAFSGAICMVRCPTVATVAIATPSATQAHGALSLS